MSPVNQRNPQLGSSVARLKEAKKFVLGVSGVDEDAGGCAGDEGMGSVLVQMMAGTCNSMRCERTLQLLITPSILPLPT